MGISEKHVRNMESTWNYTVTVHVRDVDGRTAMAQHQVSVTDQEAPTAKISSLGAEQPVDDGYRLDPEAVLRLSCGSSTDDHRVDVCAWAVDGAPNGQNTTLVASWADSGEHTVRLTVTDPSGNTDVLERRVVVVDRTAPRLSATSVSALPASVDEGASTVVRVSVDDPVDAADTLRVHWDINPLSDSDGNGVPDDDATCLARRCNSPLTRPGNAPWSSPCSILRATPTARCGTSTSTRHRPRQARVASSLRAWVCWS